MKPKTIWSSTAATFALFLLLARVVPIKLGVEGPKLWVFRLALGLLGAIAALLVYLYLTRLAHARAAAGVVIADDEVDTTLAAARTRLAAAGVPGKGRLARLPVVLVLGPGGSAKTTIVTHSGLEPELIAGEVYRGDLITATRAVNLWYAEGTVFLEAGQPVEADDWRWGRLLRQLQPRRWGAVLGRGTQAPRIAVVCLNCDELLKPGSGEAVPALARRLRTRLLETSERLGIRLPVYVVFTKADRLPYFADYVRSLTRDEAREVLGATLPALGPVTVGAWAERESARLSAAFQGLLRSLALRRPELLAREARAEIRGGAYEFPRELRKASELAMQFLLDLGRPSQLGTSPFLRGFYFSGVRPIVVSEGGAEMPPPAGIPVAAVPLEATAVFNVQQLRAAARQNPAPVARERKIPEWVFLNRLFREVILGDQAALGVTGGGARVNHGRRVLLGTAAALFLLLAAGFTRSYTGNRRLQREALAAMETARPIDRTGIGTPATEMLLRLEPLRELGVRLREHESAGRPRRLGLGLYTGPDLLREVRRLYFDRFEPLLWRETRATLLASLGALPHQPTETIDYGGTYDALKAYLITTSHPRESTAEFLAPTLLRYWPGNTMDIAAADPERLDLVRHQFEFFAGELAAESPYDHHPDLNLVEATRIVLHSFAAVEPVYQALLAETGKAIEPVRFARRFPDAEAVLRDPVVVPGAYTREGWTAIQSELARVDRLFTREAWVVGERAIPAADRARLAEELRARYTSDYLRQWRAVLDSAVVVPFTGPDDAARKLARLSGNQSPLLQLLALISAHTDLDSAGVGKAFAPVHSVLPPGVTDRYVGESNQGYMEALAALQADLDQAASAAGAERMDALGRAGASAKKVEAEVQQLARGFSIEGEAREVGRAVERLLLQPATRATALVRGAPGTALNSAGAAFCQAFQQLAPKYPFAPRATTEATAAEVAAVFQRSGSALSTLSEGALQEVVVRQGSQYVAKPGAEPRPAPAFLTSYNRAAALSAALYREDGAEREIAFVMRPQTSADLPEVTVTILGQTQRSTRTFAAAAPFTWKIGASGGARITATIDGKQLTIADAKPGSWAVFRLFQGAEWERLGNDRYRVRWQIPGHPQKLAVDLDFAGGAPLFQESYLGGITCVRQVTR